jgi:flagellar biosynthesis/type III secretory pathway M-ring protein FliF/YscJ
VFARAGSTTMDWVNQGAARLVELYKTMSPTARLCAALSLVAVLASAGWMYAQHAPPAESYLMGGQSFSASQLRHMESALGKAGLADYRIEQGRIRVPLGQQAKYMAALAEASALPADFGEYLRKAVGNSGFLVSGSRQQAQFKVAVQSDLQDLINNFRGVERSFVQIAEESQEGFGRKKTVTASVGIDPSSPEALDDRSVSAIRCIVANAWGGLKPENVTVVDLRSGRLFSGPLAETPSGGDYAGLKKQLERDWQHKVARVLGIDGAVVTANVELDPAGQTARRVSLAVAVPQSHFETLWRQQFGNLPAAHSPGAHQAALAALEQTESQRIKSALAPLLAAVDPAVDAQSLVSVTTIYSATPAVVGPANLELAVRQWLAAQWQNVALSALVVVAVFLIGSMLRNAFKTRSVTAVSGPGSPPQFSLVADDEPVAAPRQVTPPPLLPASNRHSELADRVRQDPQAAASVLKNWIGHAS